MPPIEDESSPTQYTPQWRSAPYALRLIGRLHDLKRNDPKPSEPTPSREGSMPTLGAEASAPTRKLTIIRKKNKP